MPCQYCIIPAQVGLSAPYGSGIGGGRRNPQRWIREKVGFELAESHCQGRKCWGTFYTPPLGKYPFPPTPLPAFSPQPYVCARFLLPTTASRPPVAGAVHPIRGVRCRAGLSIPESSTEDVLFLHRLFQRSGSLAYSRPDRIIHAVGRETGWATTTMG
jgi:hypothetical protein